MMQCFFKKESIFHCVVDYWLFSTVFILALAIWFLHLNQPLFYMINQLHTLIPTIIWGAINNITYTKYGILPILLIIITFLFKRDKLTLVILIYLINLGTLSILKSLVGEARPFIILPQDTFFWLKDAEDVVKTAYKSFPSGHTGNAAAFVFIIFNLFFPKSCITISKSNNSKNIPVTQLNQPVFTSKSIKILLFLFLIMTGFARICTGWHWPLDVLSSALIAFVVVNGCFYFVCKHKQCK